MPLQTGCKHFRWTAPRQKPGGGPGPQGPATAPDAAMSCERDWGTSAALVWWRRYGIAFDREPADPPRFTLFARMGAVAQTHEMAVAETGGSAPIIPPIASAFAAFFGEDVEGEGDPGSRSAEGGSVCPVPYCAKGRFSVRRMRALRSIDRLCDDCPAYEPRNSD
jgi:hypothetical protein